MNNSQQNGGTGWELSEAIRLMGEAVASGDPEQIATAMRRHGEALSNSAALVLIPTLKTTLETVLKTQIGQIARRLDNSDRARLNRNTELQEHIDKRFDGMAGEFDKMIAGQEGLARGLGKSQEDIETIFSTQTEHTARLDALDQIEAWRTEVDERILAIEKADRADIHAEIKDIKAALIRYEQKHQELIERLGQRAAEAAG
jgi:hypothetical protein